MYFCSSFGEQPPIFIFSLFRLSVTYARTVNEFSLQGVEWCPARSTNSAATDAAAPDSDPTNDDITVAEDVVESSSSGSGSGSNCCFTFAVSDAHDTEIVDESGTFCVATTVTTTTPTTGSSGEGGGSGSDGNGEDSGSSGGEGGAPRSRNITLQVTGSPELEWEKGTVQEVRPRYMFSARLSCSKE